VATLKNILPAATAVYIHIPFCVKHCAYCDFNTYVETPNAPAVQKTVDAICKDILSAAPPADTRIHTVFFGGGTPTFLTASQLTSILEALRIRFCLEPEAEISSEANPGSSDAEKFAGMRAVGFNRISIGVQSFDDNLLVRLDRFHSSSEAESAYRAARSAGFDNVSLDLMFGLPQQTLALWNQSLSKAIDLAPEHLSLYALTLEPGTRFERLHTGGKLDLPDEDTELQMYETCIQRLEQAGLRQYEVSNFAREGRECRHNLVYWRNEQYFAFGPGAVSYLNGERCKRERSPGAYIRKVMAGESVIAETDTPDTPASLGETMMLGLRLRSGIQIGRIIERHGVDPRDHFCGAIDRLQSRGLLEVSDNVMKLTHEGMLLANSVLTEFF
jgi:oxygen-independent coproporphyrinogen III oxidase